MGIEKADPYGIQRSACVAFYLSVFLDTGQKGVEQTFERLFQYCPDPGLLQTVIFIPDPGPGARIEAGEGVVQPFDDGFGVFAVCHEEHNQILRRVQAGKNIAAAKGG